MEEFNVVTPLIDEFNRKPTAILAKKIWALCHHNKIEIPENVMEFFVKEIHKQICDYDELHPPTSERMGELATALANAEALGQNEWGYKTRIYKQFAREWGYEIPDSGKEGWMKVKDDYTSFLRKYKE